MLIRKLFKASCLPCYMVIETDSGKYMKFFITPARKIKKEELVELPYWNPVGNNAAEAEHYLYNMYGFQKIGG